MKSAKPTKLTSLLTYAVAVFISARVSLTYSTTTPERTAAAFLKSRQSELLRATTSALVQK